MGSVGVEQGMLRTVPIWLEMGTFHLRVRWRSGHFAPGWQMGRIQSLGQLVPQREHCQPCRCPLEQGEGWSVRGVVGGWAKGHSPLVLFPQMSGEPATLVRYSGGCHCGAVRFEVTAPETITVIDCK